MVDVYTVAFEPWHYWEVVNSGKMVAQLSSSASPEQLEWLARNSISWTLCIHDGEFDVIAGVIFVSELAPGNGQVNMIVTNDIVPFHVRRRVVVAFRKLIDSVFASGLHRIQCEVDVTFDEGKRLVQHMGFKSEGVSPGFYEKHTDVERYAIVRR